MKWIAIPFGVGQNQKRDSQGKESRFWFRGIISNKEGDGYIVQGLHELKMKKRITFCEEFMTNL